MERMERLTFDSLRTVFVPVSSAPEGRKESWNAANAFLAGRSDGFQRLDTLIGRACSLASMPTLTLPINRFRLNQQPRNTFTGLQGNIAYKAVTHYNIGDIAKKVTSLDITDVVDGVALGQHVAALQQLLRHQP